MARVPQERQFAPNPNALQRVQTRLPDSTRGLPSRSAAADDLVKLGKGIGDFGVSMGQIGAINQARDEDREVQAKKTALQQFIRDHRYGNKDKNIVGLVDRRGADGMQGRADFDKAIADEVARVGSTSASPRVNRGFTAAAAGLQNTASNYSASWEADQRVMAERMTDLADGATSAELYAVETDDSEAARLLGNIEMLVLKEQDRLGFHAGAKDAENVRRNAVVEATSAAIKLRIDSMLQGNDPDALAAADAYFQRADIQVRLNVQAKKAIDNLLEKEARENAALLQIAATDINKVLDTGGTPPPQSTAQFEKSLAGLAGTNAGQKLISKYAEAKAHNAIIRDEHRATPLVQQDANISVLVQKQATGTITGQETRLLEKLQKITAHNRAEITKGNGVALAAEYGLIDPVEKLNLTDPMSYKNRAFQAGEASKAFGVAIQPLTAAEIKTINSMIMGKGQPNQLRGENEPQAGSTSPAKVTAMLQAMAAGLGRDVAESMAGKALQSDGAAAMVMAIAPTRPDVAQDIIAGTRIAQSDPKAFPITAKNRNTEAEAVLGTAFSGPMGAVRDTVLDAADALYAFEKSKTGNSDFDPALYQQSIERVTGGMLNSGDNKVMAPVPGMTQGRLNDLVETLSPKAMLEFSVTGGAPVFADGTPFDPQLLDKPFLSSGTDAQLFSMGIGKYGIINPGSGPVLDSNGDLYQLDLRAFNESGQPDTAIEARQTRGEQQEEKTGIKALRERGQAVVQQEDFALEQGGPDDSELDDSAPEVKDLSRPKTKDSDIGTDEAWGAGEKKFSLVSSAEAADQPLRKSDSAADRGSFGTEFKQIRDDEGVDVSVRDEKVVRHDGTTKIVPTAGWGHKLTKDEQAAIKSGEITLDEDQFEKWWRDDLQTALNGARSVVNQDDVPNDVFNILVNMHFNLGRAGVKKFKGMIKAIKAKNYKLAARHMEFSKPNAKKKTKTPWLLQTGNRAQRLIDRMKKIK